MSFEEGLALVLFIGAISAGAVAIIKAIKGTDVAAQVRHDETLDALEKGFALRLVNNSTRRKERIIGASLVIKARRRWLWHNDIITCPVYHMDEWGRKGDEIKDVQIEAMGPVCLLPCIVNKVPDDLKLPIKSEIWLRLDMVGPIRRLERRLDTLHNFVNPQ
jgi:hypothetical protein